MPSVKQTTAAMDDVVAAEVCHAGSVTEGELGESRDAQGQDGISRQKRQRGVAVSVSCVAAGFAVAHVVWPDIKIDTITVLLLVVAAAPWLGDLFDSIELPGGARFEYRRLENRIEAAEERTTRLDQEVDGAAATARVALAAAGSADWVDNTENVSAAQAAMERLASEFTRLRQTEVSSRARTAQQERIFAELVKVTPHIPSLDLQAMLASEDPGRRLTAHARLYAVPDATKFDLLVDAVLREQLPFLRYWGFNALGRVVDELGADQVPVGAVRRLRACLTELPSGSDRARALQRVLAKLSTH
ncbi:hypothetical protein [Actinacidiphila glaucinigra]|uniref:hypothetical protein n=1 Tax=Actinacidiphila glaucinigra TaxID=235986 RepID=UPI0035D5F140